MVLSALDWDYALDMDLGPKRKLLGNRSEKQIYPTLHQMDSSTLINKLYGSKQTPYQSWTKDKWACTWCLHKFFWDTVPFWWLDRKRRGNAIWL